VFKQDPFTYHELIGVNDKSKLLALDCEMIYTIEGMELARLSVVDENLKTVLDVMVQTAEVLDYNSRFSGITPESYEQATRLSLAQAQLRLMELMGPQTILVGHSLENDLKAMHATYKRCIDTCILYPHPRGLPYKMSLQRLTREHLRRFIQEDSSGHDSVEDAKATMELLLLKLKR
jgi:RNA exonuclease 1